MWSHSWSNKKTIFPSVIFIQTRQACLHAQMGHHKLVTARTLSHTDIELCFIPFDGKYFEREIVDIVSITLLIKYPNIDNIYIRHIYIYTWFMVVPEFVVAPLGLVASLGFLCCLALFALALLNRIKEPFIYAIIVCIVALTCVCMYIMFQCIRISMNEPFSIYCINIMPYN